MSLLLTFQIKDDAYNIVVDASVRETHTGSAQVTEHPVEVGSNISDHVRPLPDRLNIDGIISNTPILDQPRIPNTAPNDQILQSELTNGYVGGPAKRPTITVQTPFFNTQPPQASGIALQFPTLMDRVKTTEQALSRAREFGALLNVYTSLKYYSNMVIENLTINRDAQNSNNLRFTMDLKRIVFVSSQQVKARAPTKQKKNKGATPPKEDKPQTKEQKRESIAKSAKTFLSSTSFGGG